MHPRWLLLLFGLVTCTEAILRLKLQHWYPTYETYWQSQAPFCQAEMTAYLENIRTPDCPNPCACAADCYMRNLTGTMQTDFNSANVLLGLVPAVIVFIGPTVAEVTALSTHRPVLAILIALASPAVNLPRLFRPIDVNEPFKDRDWTAVSMCASWLADRKSRVWMRAWVVAAYILALVALANNVQNSILTDLRTICGWRCGALFMPLVWSLLAVVVHGWGMLGMRAREMPGTRPFLGIVWTAEIFTRVDEARETMLSEFCFWMASVMGIIQMVFGILTLSSLYFIDVLEALQVFVLYAVSAALCQFVLTAELANLRTRIARTKRK